MELYGYNRNDVRAQNLMTKVEDEDIFRKNFRCTARIAVTDAYFADEYKPRCLHRPYMMMEGQVESVFPLDTVESDIRLIGIHAFVGLVNDEDIPFHVTDFPQLVVLAAEVHGSFEVLQGYELDTVVGIG